MVRTPRKWSLSVGRILGFPVDVHASLLVLLALMLVFGGPLKGAMAVLLAALAFASVLVHELGHSVVARALGVPIAGISLYPFGGIAKMAGMPRGARSEFAIAVAGPVVSLGLAGVFGILSLGLEGNIGALARYLARINGLLGLFNLIPALPMDGGRMLRAWWATRVDFSTATLNAVRVSRFCSWAMIVGGLFSNLWLVVIGVFVLLAASREERMVRAGWGHYRGHQGWTVVQDPAGGIVIDVPGAPR